MTAPTTTSALGLPLDNDRMAFLKLDAMASILAGFAPDQGTTVQSTRTFGYRSARYITDAGAVAKVASGTIVCTDDAVRFVQWDADNGVTLETAINPVRYKIARVTCADGIITEIEDIRDVDLHTPHRVRWRGVWSAGTYRRHDAVRHVNDVWIATVTTTDTPGPGTDWEVMVYGVPDPSTADDDDALLVYGGELFYGPVDGVSGSTLDFEDEGTPQGTGGTLNVVGDGASIAVSGGVATLTVPGADLSLFSLRHRIKYLAWIANNNTPVFLGLNAPALLGTAGAGSLATTNFNTSQVRGTHTASSTGTNQNAGRSVNGASTTILFLGDAANVGGFTLVIRSCLVSPIAKRGFFGAATANGVGSSDPSSKTDLIGMGWDDGDTNWHLIHNDGAGGATMVDTGVAFALNTVYEVVIDGEPNSTGITVALYSVTASGRTTLYGPQAVTTDLPAGGTALSPTATVSNGAAGGDQPQLDIHFWLIDTR